MVLALQQQRGRERRKRKEAEVLSGNRNSTRGRNASEDLLPSARGRSRITSDKTEKRWKRWALFSSKKECPWEEAGFDRTHGWKRPEGGSLSTTEKQC